MRISNIVRTLEDSAIVAAAKLGSATRQFSDEVNKEFCVRKMYAVESAATKRQRLAELRGVVEALDRVQQSGTDEERANAAAFVAKMTPAPKAKKTKRS